jgi:hypothetical protein
MSDPANSSDFEMIDYHYGRTEVEQLRAQLAEVTAERDKLKARADRLTGLLRESHAACRRQKAKWKNSFRLKYTNLFAGQRDEQTRLRKAAEADLAAVSASRDRAAAEAGRLREAMDRRGDRFILNHNSDGTWSIDDSDRGWVPGSWPNAATAWLEADAWTTRNEQAAATWQDKGSSLGSPAGRLHATASTATR